MKLLNLMMVSELCKLHTLVNVLEKIMFTRVVHLKLAMLLDFCDVLNRLNFFVLLI